MFSQNRVTLYGTLGKDPEIRNLPNGGQVANFSVATSDDYKDKSSGEWKKVTDWHNVVAWGPFAKQAEKLRKGSKVYAEGKLKTRKWTDQSGVDKYSTEVVIQGFDGRLIGDKSGNSGGGESYDQTAKGPAPKPDDDDMADSVPF